MFTVVHLCTLQHVQTGPLVMLVKVVCPNIDLCVCVPRNNRNAFELDQAGEKMLGLTQAAW